MRKENVVNKNKCFPGKFLSGVSRLYGRLVNKETTLLYQQRISGRSRIKCGITSLFDNSGFSPALVIPVLAVRAHAGYSAGYKSGFTLIELLVVVLIIGILAAVALPKYQTAVNKARFSNLRTTAESLLKAAQSYTAATNEWPDNFDVLAVDLPGGFTQNKIGTFTCGKNTTMYCCMITGGGWSPAVTCGKKDYTFAFYSKYTTDLVIDAPMNNFCVAKESDANAKQLCKSLTKREGALTGWGLVTPENTNLGGKTGYRWYTL